MTDDKPKILFLHTIPAQEKEWLKLLDSQEIRLIIESVNTNITELLQKWRENQITLPDLVLIDITAKTPDGHFYQVSSLSRWCKENKIYINIFGLNGEDEDISSFQESWAKYQGLNGIFPKLTSKNLISIVSRLSIILGIKINPVTDKKPPMVNTVEDWVVSEEEENQTILEEKTIDTTQKTQKSFVYTPKLENNFIYTPKIENNFIQEEKLVEKIVPEINNPIISSNGEILIEEKITQESLKHDISPVNQSQVDLESLNQEIVKNPFSADLFVQKGDIYLSQGNDQQALNNYDQAIKLDSKNEKALFARGHLLVKLGDYRNAIKDLTLALKFNRNNPFAYHDRGLALFRSGDERGAKRDYDQAIKLKSDFSQVYNDRGFLQYLLGNTNIAIQNYKQAIKHSPNYADAYYNRGNIYSDLGQFKEAIADYTEAIRCNPNFALAYGNRGIAYYELDLVAEAIKDTTKSANLFYEQGDLQSYQQAIATLKQMQ